MSEVRITTTYKFRFEDEFTNPTKENMTNSEVYRINMDCLVKN